MDFSASYKKESVTAKNIATEEESDPEKDSKGKEKSEEQEKFYSGNNHRNTHQFQLSNRDKFACFNTSLDPHPYQETDIQPPKAV